MGGYLTTVKNGDIEYFYFGKDESSRKMFKTTIKLKEGTYQTNFYDSEKNRYEIEIINNYTWESQFQRLDEHNKYYAEIQRSVIHSKRHDYKNGTLVTFDGAGKMTSKYALVNNVRDGPYEIYKNDKLVESGTIRNNIKDGLITEYQGDIRIETTYQSGIKHGECKKYQNEELVQIIKYFYGNQAEVIDECKVREKQKQKEAEVNKTIAEMKQESDIQIQDEIETLPSAPPYTEEGADATVNEVPAVRQPRGRPKKQSKDSDKKQVEMN